MGWLRDLMTAADPPVRSFEKLAVAASKTPDWPTGNRVQTRSLATLLGRLDRGQDLSWLADRQAIQIALARSLGVPLDEIRRALGPRATGSEDARTYRLRDLPTARPLDFTSDELPPGVPLEVLSAPSRGLWWLAPSGSGRSLVGRWLAARGRARFIESEDGSDLDARTDEGPLFLELGRPNASGGQQPKARPGLCVAAPFAPEAGSGFEVLHSPELLAILEPLLDWAAARLPGDSRFEPALTREFFAERVQAGSFDTLGVVLGVIGLFDELGPRELLAKPLAKVAQKFVETRIARSVDPAMPFASWLRRAIYPTLVGMAERALVDSDLPIETPRSFEEWLALVPPELERHVDLEWMRLSLSQIDSAIRPGDVERAARKLPPGAFRVVSSLEQAGLLRRDAHDRLALGPAWLRTTLQHGAIEALLTRSPFDWGEALLRPHAAAQMAEALLDRTLREGSSALEPVLDLEAEDQPAYAAAADMALRVAGIARLLGAELGQEVLDGLWSENAELALELEGALPLPRIALDTQSVRPPRGRGQALLSSGTFYLAALSVSETLEDRHSGALAALDPWHTSEPEPRLAAAYDAIQDSLRSDPPWRRAALLMVARARAAVGNALGPDEPHALELPAQILDEVEHGVLTFATLERGDASADWLEPALSLADARGLSRGELARAVWAAWEHAGRPDGAAFLAPEAREHALFWAHVPAALLTHLLFDVRRRNVPYAVFGDEQWQAFARALERFPDLVGDDAAWAAMPLERVAELLVQPLEWSRAGDSVRVLWQRFPELLANAVRRQLGAGAYADSDALGALLAAAPSSTASELLDQLGERTSGLAPPALSAMRQLLRRLVGERGPDWREAYRTLARLERELSRVR
jgi:hypothetical protein